MQALPELTPLPPPLQERIPAPSLTLGWPWEHNGLHGTECLCFLSQPRKQIKCSSATHENTLCNCNRKYCNRKGKGVGPHSRDLAVKGISWVQRAELKCGESARLQLSEFVARLYPPLCVISGDFGTQTTLNFIWF